jgi:putrescine transport system substrate-binding protein
MMIGHRIAWRRRARRQVLARPNFVAMENHPVLNRFAALLLITAVSVAFSPAAAAERVVNVFNWSDYIDAKALDDFTRETGIKVIYDTYDSNEMLETRLLAGATGYDVVVPSAPFLARQIRAGVLTPLDKSKLPNAKNLWPEIQAKLAPYDPGNRYAVDYMWYTTGIAYNVEKVKERLGDKPLVSWEQVLRPENLKKFSDCGVYVVDSPEDLFSVALNYLKLDPNSKRPEDIGRAEALLVALRPYIKKFHSSEYINALANGDICLAIGWSGDTYQAKARAEEANNGVEISFVIPREGSLVTLDALAIPKDAPHPDEAHAFIDYLMRPDVAARNSNASRFANGVIASRPLLDPAILDNKWIYPDAATMTKLFAVTAPDLVLQRTVTRAWTHVKTGR